MLLEPGRKITFKKDNFEFDVISKAPSGQCGRSEDGYGVKLGAKVILFDESLLRQYFEPFNPHYINETEVLENIYTITGKHVKWSLRLQTRISTGITYTYHFNWNNAVNSEMHTWVQ